MFLMFFTSEIMNSCARISYNYEETTTSSQKYLNYENYYMNYF